MYHQRRTGQSYSEPEVHDWQIVAVWICVMLFWLTIVFVLAK